MRIAAASKKAASSSQQKRFVPKNQIDSAAKWKSFFSIIALVAIATGGYFLYDNYSIEKNFQQCVMNRKTGSYTVAAAFCEKTLKRRPRNIRAWEELALAYSDADMPDKANATVKTALKWGETPTLYAIMGKLYYDKDKNEDAEKALKKALKLDPSNRTANHYMGFILYQNKDYQAALGHMERALKDASRADFMVLNDVMGDSYAALNNHKKAIDSYKNVLSKDMNLMDICIKLTKQYLLDGNLESAAGEINRCSLISPENEEANTLKVKINRQKDRVEIIEYVKARKNMDDVFMMIYSSVSLFIQRFNSDPSAYIGQPVPELDDAMKDTNNLLENYRKLPPPATYHVVHTQILTGISTLNDTLGYIKQCVTSGERERCITLADYTAALEQRVGEMLAIWEHEKKDPELRSILEAPVDPKAILLDDEDEGTDDELPADDEPENDN